MSSRQVGWLFLQLQRATLRERERSQIVNQPRQHARLVENRLQMRVVARIYAVEQSFEVALNHCRAACEVRASHLRAARGAVRRVACKRAAIELNARASERTSRGPRSATRAE